LLLVQQNLDFVKRQYQVVETYSSNIIYSVSDAVVVLDSSMKIKLFNRAAEDLFIKDENEAINQPLSFLFDDKDCTVLLDSATNMREIVCDVHKRKKYLLISKSKFIDENNKQNVVFVIRDLTGLRKMEQQIERNERLSAMGELASGVAHEIRNPLNTIGTIVQQLDKDFEPMDHQDDYHELAKIVYKEVKRINETVQDFLRFARPEPIKPETFSIQDFFSKIEKQYQSLLDENNISLKMTFTWEGSVFWDPKQMQQVFMNLIQNAVDELFNGGQIRIFMDAIQDEKLEIQITDNGRGIAEQFKSKIFNLYFTTKAKGTGIGLSIVQRIVYEHGGVISVESVENKGTTFIIQMPIEVNSIRK
jgi:PAS domain S-box-containing protein